MVDTKELLDNLRSNLEQSLYNAYMRGYEEGKKAAYKEQEIAKQITEYPFTTKQVDEYPFVSVYAAPSYTKWTSKGPGDCWVIEGPGDSTYIYDEVATLRKEIEEG